MAGSLGRRIGAGAGLRGNVAFRWRPGAQNDLRMGVGYGLLNAGLYAEDRIKADTPVRGGHRSFLTGSHLGGPVGIADLPGTRRAKVTVGGTLRRSVHAIVHVDGRIVPGSRTVDENGVPVPSYNTGGAHVVLVLGTNAGYGLWVDGGTGRMPARPFVMQGVALMGRALGSLARSGTDAYWRTRR